MIYLLRNKATSAQVAEMLKEHESMIKFVVDIRPRFGNRSTLLQSEELRQQVASVAIEILGGVYDAQ